MEWSRGIPGKNPSLKMAILSSTLHQCLDTAEHDLKLKPSLLRGRELRRAFRVALSLMLNELTGEPQHAVP